MHALSNAQMFAVMWTLATYAWIPSPWSCFIANNSVTLTAAATSIIGRLFIAARMSPSVLSRSFGSSLNRLASSSCSQHASNWHFVSAWDMSVADLKVSQCRLNIAHSSAVAPPAIRGLSTFGGLCFWVALLWTFVWCSYNRPMQSRLLWGSTFDHCASRELTAKLYAHGWRLDRMFQINHQTLAPKRVPQDPPIVPLL